MFKQKKIMSITALITFIKNQMLHFTPLFLASSTSRNESLKPTLIRQKDRKKGNLKRRK